MDAVHYTELLVDKQIKAYIAVYRYSSIEFFKDTRELQEVYRDICRKQKKPAEPLDDDSMDAVIVTDEKGFTVIARTVLDLKTALKGELIQHIEKTNETIKMIERLEE